MKKFLIILFALAMFLFGKFFCEVKPEWSEYFSPQQEVRNSSANKNLRKESKNMPIDDLPRLKLLTVSMSIILINQSLYSIQ